MAGGYPIRSTSLPIERAIFEEGLHGIHLGGIANGTADGGGFKITATNQAVIVNVLPNYNPNISAVIRARTRLAWKASHPVFVAGGARDWFVAASSFISTGSCTQGEIEFESDINYPNLSVSLFSSFATGGTIVTGDVWSSTSYTMMCNDLDFEAQQTLVWMGDSVSLGTVNSDLLSEQFYQQIVKRHLAEKLGTRLRLATYARGGTTSASATTMLNNGLVRASDPAVIAYQYGINDQAQSVSVANYQAGIERAIRWKQYRHPKARMLCIDATPCEQNARETALGAYRTAMAATVAAAADPLVVYVGMGGCYDRTQGLAIYAASDTSGDRLHPGTALAHAAMAARISSVIDLNF